MVPGPLGIFVSNSIRSAWNQVVDAAELDANFLSNPQRTIKRSQKQIGIAIFKGVLWLAETNDDEKVDFAKKQLTDVNNYEDIAGNFILSESAIVGGKVFLPGESPLIRNVSEAANSAAKGGAKTFFEGAKYSDKVLRQMGKADDIYHAFSKSVDGFATKFGKWSTEVGADGKTYQWLKMPGSYGGKTGTFDYIKDANGVINHRFFNVTP